MADRVWGSVLGGGGGRGGGGGGGGVDVHEAKQRLSEYLVSVGARGHLPPGVGALLDQRNLGLVTLEGLRLFEAWFGLDAQTLDKVNGVLGFGFGRPTCFFSSAECDQALANKPWGTWILRFSQSADLVTFAVSRMEDKVVHRKLFYEPGCGFCANADQGYLPTLHELLQYLIQRWRLLPTSLVQRAAPRGASSSSSLAAAGPAIRASPPPTAVAAAPPASSTTVGASSRGAAMRAGPASNAVASSAPEGRAWKKAVARRYEMDAGASITYRGVVMVAQGFTPSQSLFEDMQANYQAMGLVKGEFILAECRRWLCSFPYEHEDGLMYCYRLSGDELLALGLYTYDLGFAGEYEENFFRVFNRMLQERDASKMHAWRPYLYHLFAALNKLSDVEAQVYRGVSDPSGFVKSNYTVGREVHWSSFSSATTDEEVARRFAQGHDGVLFRIHVFGAKDISPFSVLGNEKELLLSPNLNFLVADTFPDPATGITVVKLVQKKGDKLIY